MSDHPTSPDSRSAIFSLASEDGHSPCDSLASRQLRAAGREVLRASLSAWLDEVAGNTTNVTWLRPFSISSQSVVLQCYLGNRLEQQSLKTIGSMLYCLSWKNMATPAGRQFCQLQASMPRIKGSESSLEPWPTTAASDPSGGGSAKIALSKMAGEKRPSGHTKATSLRDYVQLAFWPTSAATDGKGGYLGGRIRNGKLSVDRLDVAAQLATWSTPTANASTGAGNSGRKGGLNIQTQAQLAQWPPELMAQPIRITASGQVLTGSSAGMGISGPLNPAHSRWLMGFPPVWDDCAVMAMQSSRQLSPDLLGRLSVQLMKLSEAIFNNRIARENHEQDI